MKRNAKIGNRKWGTAMCHMKEMMWWKAFPECKKPKGYWKTPGNGCRRQCTSKWIMWPYPWGWLHTGFNEMLCVDSIKRWLPPQAPGGKQGAVVHFVKHAQERLWATFAGTLVLSKSHGHVITWSKHWVKKKTAHRKDNSILFGDEVVIKPEGNYFATTAGVIK